VGGEGILRVSWIVRHGFDGQEPYLVEGEESWWDKGRSIVEKQNRAIAFFTVLQ
jgi:hypothetical protein